MEQLKIKDNKELVLTVLEHAVINQDMDQKSQEKIILLVNITLLLNETRKIAVRRFSDNSIILKISFLIERFSV